MKTKKEIEQEISRLKSDERMKASPATVEVNAPLALIQLELEAKITALKWVLLESGRNRL